MPLSPEAELAPPGMFWRSVLVLAMACAGAALLSSCAQTQGGAGGSTAASRADIVTDSDEPDARRRARIRLELATGYFEQGKTTVALDELKQALANDPTFVEAYSLRGLIYMRLNDLPVAEDSFKRALALRPSNASVMHNLGWLLCQQGRFPESSQYFTSALSDTQYIDRPKTFMALGLCQLKGGQRAEAEKNLMQAYELDPANPVTGYNLALLMYENGDFTRSRFYVRRINNSDLANAETLWLGIRVERRMGNREAVDQLATQLRRRFGDSPEWRAYDRGAFDG